MRLGHLLGGVGDVLGGDERAVGAAALHRSWRLLAIRTANHDEVIECVRNVGLGSLTSRPQGAELRSNANIFVEMHPFVAVAACGG